MWRYGTQVRVLDAAQGRVQQGIEYVSSILERSNCLTGVQEAMARGDYERAATHLKSFTAAAGTKFIMQASEQKTEEEMAAAANDQSSKQLVRNKENKRGSREDDTLYN